MITLRYTIELVADAHPGTGVGSEAIDDTVPRDHHGRPVIWSWYLKGLLRQRLLDLGALRGWPAGWVDALLGAPGDAGSGGEPSRLHLTSATLEDAGESEPVRTIHRTALTRHGTALEGSLRSQEAIAAGTRFTGTVRIDCEPGQWPETAARLGLLTLDALGGRRSRGSGACLIHLEEDDASPADLLRRLDSQLEGTDVALAQPPLPASRPVSGGGDEPAVWCRLNFAASGPVCCAEIPVGGHNLIRSGFAIPASAVQGALLTRLNAVDAEAASGCFASAAFRCWPLLPVGSDGVDAPGLPVRVALSHRMSKLADADDNHDFKDSAIEPYDWRHVAQGSPLKACDGVLIRRPSGEVVLWRSADMPRQFSAHAVHNGATDDGRGLYQVEAMAALVFGGLAALPASVADRLAELLDRDPEMRFGRSRSVRGEGTLSLQRLEAPPVLDWEPGVGLAGRVFIVQSPVAIPDDWPLGPAAETLGRLVADAGLGDVARSVRCGDLEAPGVYATARVLFGWNRHGHGAQGSRAGRLRARRVIEPGAVFVLKAPVADAAAAMLRGLGEGRGEGLGALLPHPGIADARLIPEPEAPTLASRDAAGAEGLALFEAVESARGRGPSASQIAALADRIGRETAAARDYLQHQRTQRSSRYADLWQPVSRHLDRLLGGDAQEARRALRCWQDLVIRNRTSEEARR